MVAIGSAVRTSIIVFLPFGALHNGSKDGGKCFFAYGFVFGIFHDAHDFYRRIRFARATFSGRNVRPTGFTPGKNWRARV